MKLRDETGSVVPEQMFRSRRRKIDKSLLQKAIKEKPDVQLSELASLFRCNIPAVFYALKKMGITLKKTFTYAEKSEEKRTKFVEYLARVPEEKRVYVEKVAWINAWFVSVVVLHVALKWRTFNAVENFKE